MIHERYYVEKAKQEALLARKNNKSDFTMEYMTDMSILCSQGSIHRLSGDMI